MRVAGAAALGVSAEPWYRDRRALRLILLGYAPWLAGLNLAWESGHLPLYRLWTEAPAGYIAFSVVHCTLGDLAIGTAALLLALVSTRSTALAQWNWRRIAVLTVLFGASYTFFSEWANLARQSWQYSELMPVLRAAGVEVGLSPLAQWLVIPPLALWFGRRTVPRADADREGCCRTDGGSPGVDLDQFKRRPHT